MTKICYTQARKQFSLLLNQAAFSNRKYTITRRDKPLAALVPINYLVLLERVAQEFAKIKVPKR